MRCRHPTATKQFPGPSNLPIFAGFARAIALAFENRGVLLLVQPLEKFLKACVGQDGCHGVEGVAKFIVTPGFVDEVLTGMAGGHNFSSALAAWDDMMAARGHRSFAKNAL
jgi:hypothetical protein